jgi:outer membrane receptor protein involved in Fe transport
LDGTPLLGTRLFETEFFDLERVEVLRGPQGTLFGRNATSGVVNFIPVRPDLTGFKASGEVDYGNYNQIKTKGMINLPLGSKMAARVAGFYMKRDGYTTNLFNDSKIDDRDMYAVRGSLRWEPSDSTTVDLSAYYFHEKDNRMRIQKQMCQRDPTGVLGCLPNAREYGITNANSTTIKPDPKHRGLNTVIDYAFAAGKGCSYPLGEIHHPTNGLTTLTAANTAAFTRFDGLENGRPLFAVVAFQGVLSISAEGKLYFRVGAQLLRFVLLDVDGTMPHVPSTPTRDPVSNHPIDDFDD